MLVSVVKISYFIDFQPEKPNSSYWGRMNLQGPEWGQVAHSKWYLVAEPFLTALKKEWTQDYALVVTEYYPSVVATLCFFYA